jgi:hypothetical protein
MPWRAEHEISQGRQRELERRRPEIEPGYERGAFPFNGVEPTLTRTDIEWLLATHEGGRGRVIWAEEKGQPSAQRRMGLDLRGADIRKLDLVGLPPAQMQRRLPGLK